MLQFPWLLTGVVIVETLFNYRGFGWLLIEGGGEQRHRPAARLLDRRRGHRARHPADLRHRLRLPQPAHPGRLMELAFLTPWAIVAGTLARFLPVWIGMAAIMGRASSSAAGSAPTGGSTTAASASSASALVLFWLLTALMAHWVAPFDPYVQVRALQNEPPGALVAGARPPLPLRRRRARARRLLAHGLRQPHGDGDRTPRDALRLHGRDHPRAAGRLPRRLARHPALASSPTSSSPSR